MDGWWIDGGLMVEKVRWGFFVGRAGVGQRFRERREERMMVDSVGILLCFFARAFFCVWQESRSREVGVSGCYTPLGMRRASYRKRTGCLVLLWESFVSNKEAAGIVFNLLTSRLIVGHKQVLPCGASLFDCMRVPSPYLVQPPHDVFTRHNAYCLAHPVRSQSPTTWYG